MPLRSDSAPSAMTVCARDPKASVPEQSKAYFFKHLRTFSLRAAFKEQLGSGDGERAASKRSRRVRRRTDGEHHA